MSINKCVLAGNLTRDIELRSTQSGMTVGNMGIAVNERVKQGDQWTDKPHYFDLVMFGTRAEKLAQYLTKGTKVCVEGKLRWSQWQDRDGNKRSKVEVVVDEIELMSGGQGRQQQQAAPYQQAPQYAPQNGSQPYQVPQFVEATLYDEDIPFG